MSDLFIKGTSSSPEIDFKTSGELTIGGKSIPENANKLFEPIVKWLEDYSCERTVFSVKLEYFNTSTSKILYDILKDMESRHKKGNLIIKWYYEEGDEDVLDAGQYYESLMQTSFEYYVMSEQEMMDFYEN